MPRRRISLRHSALACFGLAATAAAQDGTYYFTGAVTVQGADGGGSYSPAQQAVCPGGYEQRCDAIGASDYCCPASNTCSWASSSVQCCAAGQTCSGYSSGDNTYQPLSSYAAPPPQSTVYYSQPPATTVYAGGGGAYIAPAADSSPVGGYAGYCSTYYAEGPNLPTTRPGECGTVLVIEPGEGVRWAVGMARFWGMVLGLNVVGGLLFGWR